MIRKQTENRSDFVRQRRQQQSSRRLTQTVQRAGKPLTGHTRPVSHQAVNRSRSHRQQYGFAFALGTAEVQTPGISIPQPGPRLVSGILFIVFGFLLIMLWTSPTFTVISAELVGNQRLDVADINAVLSVKDKPIFLAMPKTIEKSLLLALPDLESVDVRISLPNRVIVTVKERSPIISWTQDDQVKWIDINGMAFPNRGQLDTLIPIISTGNPPVKPPDPEQVDAPARFLEPEMIQAVLTLLPYIPSGTTLTYDPTYGLGWQDGRGWLVYFGENISSIDMKLVVYQAIIDHLTRTGIRPTLVSVEYLDAPYYR